MKDVDTQVRSGRRALRPSLTVRNPPTSSRLHNRTKRFGAQMRRARWGRREMIKRRSRRSAWKADSCEQTGAGLGISHDLTSIVAGLIALAAMRFSCSSRTMRVERPSRFERARTSKHRPRSARPHESDETKASEAQSAGHCIVYGWWYERAPGDDSLRASPTVTNKCRRWQSKWRYRHLNVARGLPRTSCWARKRPHVRTRRTFLLLLMVLRI